MGGCSVPGCRSYYGRKKGRNGEPLALGEPLSLFHFPYDPKLRAEWISRCQVEISCNPESFRVCSEHFLKDDYDGSYLTKCSLGLRPTRAVLQKGAVPSQNLPSTYSRTSLLAEYADEDCDGAPPADDTSLLDPVRRAAIVDEAIADLEKREQEEREQEEREGIPQFLSLVDTQRKASSWKSAPTSRTSAPTGLTSAPTGLTSAPTSRTSAPTGRTSAPTGLTSAPTGRKPVLILPKGAPTFRKVTLITRKENRKPAPPTDAALSNGELDDGDELGRQLKAMRALQRQTRVLEGKLADKRCQLQQALERQDAARATLSSLAGGRKKTGGRKRTGEQSAAAPGADRADAGGDPLVVLRSEQDPSDLLSVPADLAEAKCVIFNLRLEVLALRKSALKHAHSATALRIDTIEKDVKRDVKHAALVKRLRDALDVVFSSAQQSHLMPNKKVVPWDCDDYLRAIALRRLCRRRTFDYVRNTMKIPLPSMFALRSVAAFGRFPEVTRCYRELREQKKLRFIRAPAVAQKPAQCDSDASERPDPDTTERPDPDTTERPVPDTTDRPAPKRRGRGGGAGRGRKRKRKAAPEEEPEPGRLSPRKPCWDAVDLTERIDSSDEHSSGIDEAWSRHVRTSLSVRGRPRGRGRGWGRSRAGRAGPDVVWLGGKRGPGHPSGMTFLQESEGHRF